MDPNAPTETHQHSEDVAQFIGKREFDNTLRNNRVAENALARFVYPNENCGDAIALLKTKLFLNENPNDLSLAAKKYINWQLIEFAVGYRKSNADRVSPETMLNYIRALRRVFISWGYVVEIFTDPVFKDNKNGLLPVLDNLFSDQQIKGSSPQRKNTLSKKDFRTLLNSPSCDKNTSSGFMNRLILITGLTLGVRTTEMVHLTLDQFDIDIKLKEQDVIVFRAKVGSYAGSSKGKRGGIKQVGRRPTEIVIWNTPLLDGALNVYVDIYEYITLRRKSTIQTDRFFVHYHSDKYRGQSHFEDRPVGKNFFNPRLREMCKNSNVTGDGVKNYITMHSLRATMIQWLLDEGHPATVIATRTGHRDIQSLHAYNHLHSEEGYNQQMSLFKDTGSLDPSKSITESLPIKKRKKEEYHPRSDPEHKDIATKFEYWKRHIQQLRQINMPMDPLNTAPLPHILSPLRFI